MKTLTAPATFFMSLVLSLGHAQTGAPLNGREFIPHLNTDMENNSSTGAFSDDNDGGIPNIDAVPSFQCNPAVTPSIVVENFGKNTLISALIRYTLDDGSPYYYQWTGSLSSGEADTVLLPTLAVSTGTHELLVSITEVNGFKDSNESNDKSIQFNIIGTSYTLPIHADFETGSLPPGFFIDDAHQGPTWKVYNFQRTLDEHGFAMQMEFHNSLSLPGTVNDLFIQNFDLSTFKQAVLTFDLAYTYYSDIYYDQLKIQVSSDCGASWAEVYKKEKDELRTAPVSDIYFVPTPEEWRKESIDLSNFSGNSNVLVRFEAISGLGNNLYIDNIDVSAITGIGNPAEPAATFELYPNPANNVVIIHSGNSSNVDKYWQVTNELRQQMVTIHDASSSIEVNTNNWPNGIYLVNCMSNSHLLYQRRLDVLHQ